MEHELARQDPVAVVTLTRPERLNALSVPGFRGLAQTFADLAKDEGVRCLVISGRGRGFCAGAALDSFAKDLGGAPGGGIAADVMEDAFDGAVNAMMRALWTMPKPIVTAVNGVASGGGVGLALAGDVVLAARGARFDLPFVPRLGILPDCGASWLVTRRAGPGRALAAMLTGAPIPAERARDWGLVWQVTDEAALLPEALDLARDLARGPVAMARPLRQAVAAATTQDLDAQLDLERDVNVARCGSANFAEGVAAFLVKRAPVFDGEAERDA
jgi:2-(1,2-epoxy-1,2-dihydrophenyl)acetyl-CoA isomerase